MRSVTLIKGHPSVQIAHLYEHLFVMRAKDLFFMKGLYKGLDYWITGTTFEQGGLVKVSYDLYSDAAIALEGDIQKILLDLENTTQISRALSQIVAEEPFVLRITNKQLLLKELSKLNNKPWVIDDEVEAIDTKNIRLRNTHIYLAAEEQVKPRVLKTTVSLDPVFANDNHILLPLFNIFSRWLIFTPDDVIADSNGFYSGDIYGSAKTFSVFGELLIAPHLSKVIDLEVLYKTAKDIMVEMLSPDTLTKLSLDIQDSTAKETDSSIMPDRDRILIQTGIYIGLGKLKELASAENLALLAKHCTLEMRFGRKSIARTLY